MKKIISFLIMIIIIIAIVSTSIAVEKASFEVKLSTVSQNIKPGDEVVVTLKVSNFKNMTDGIFSFLASINYDEKVFEKLTQDNVKGLGTWSSVPTFNPTTGLVTADSGSGVKTDSDVISITFKVKETAEIEKSTEIIVKDFEASEGEEDLQANDAKLTINILKKDNGSNSGNTNDNNIGNNNDNNNQSNNTVNNNGNAGNNQNSNTNSNNQNGNKNNSNNKNSDTANKPIPQTGSNEIAIIVSIFLAIVLSIAFYIKNKKYQDIK